MYKEFGAADVDGGRSKVVKVFSQDAASDVSSLPGIDDVAAHSMAIIAKTGDVYMLDSNGTWNKWG